MHELCSHNDLSSYHSVFIIGDDIDINALSFLLLCSEREYVGDIGLNPTVVLGEKADKGCEEGSKDSLQGGPPAIDEHRAGHSLPDIRQRFGGSSEVASEEFEGR